MASYTLRTEPHEPCKHCGHKRAHEGLHAHPACPGLNASEGGCLTVHFSPDRGHRRCQGRKGWSVLISLGFGNNRLYRVCEDKEGGLRCRTCAGHHAEMLNIQARARIRRAA